MDGHKAFYHAVGAYTEVLARHPPPYLRHLTLRIPIHLRPGRADVTKRRDLWCQMDDAISRLSTLENVTLEVRSLETLDRAEKHTFSVGFQHVLARVHARGILCIRFEVSSSAIFYIRWRLNVHDDLCRGCCKLTLPTVRLNFCRPVPSLIVCKPVNSATPFAFALRPVTESEANFKLPFSHASHQLQPIANSE